MSPVYKLSSNSTKNGRTIYGSMLAGNTTFNPSSFESIATASITDDVTKTVTFDSIPQTYTHLQIRGIFRNTRSGSGNDFVLASYNNTTTNSYYDYHYIEGNGSTISVGTSVSSRGLILGPANSNTNVGLYSGFVVDILDYTNTNKYKTVRTLQGYDDNANSVGYVWFLSELWEYTDAITKIDLTMSGVHYLKQYSHFALYGIKAAA